MSVRRPVSPCPACVRAARIGALLAAVGFALQIGTLHGQQPVVVRPAAAHLPQPPAETLPPVAAQVLTLADLEHIAVANNPSLARTQAMVAAARGSWVQAGLYPNPEVGYLGQQLGSGGEAEQHGILFEQEFVRGGKLALSRAVAEQEIVRAEQQYAAQLQRVLTDVRIAFYEALLAQRRLELTRELTNIGQQAHVAAEQLRRGGELSRADVLQAQLELEQAQIQQANAENRHAAVWRSLTAVIGVPQMPPSVLNGDLEGVSPGLTWESSLQRLLTTSPEIAAAVANIDRARLALEREAVEPIPNVTVQGVVMQDNGIGGKTDGNLQLTFPLPLWNKNQGAIRRAEAELAAAQRAFTQVELDLQQRLAAVFERYASAAAQVQRYRERILPAARESLSLIRQVFEAGEAPYLNLLNAQRTYSQANLSYLDSLREFQSAAAEIDGLLLRGSLQASPER